MHCVKAARWLGKEVINMEEEAMPNPNKLMQSMKDDTSKLLMASPHVDIPTSIKELAKTYLVPGLKL